MTSVVGILNKRGVAIAADSAVTRQRSKDGRWAVKCTKNGNKMVRLCEAVPVTVMITGNADYLSIPWDVIVRCYRRDRRQEVPRTVEEAIHKFFAYIQSKSEFWEDELCCDFFLRSQMDSTFDAIVCEMDVENEHGPDGSLLRPATFVRSFRRIAASLQKSWLRDGICPQFEDYSLEQFRSAARGMVGGFLDQKGKDACIGFHEDYYQQSVLDGIRPAFEEVVWTALRTRKENGPVAELIFSGFGKDQIYPSLVAVRVCEGFDRHVNYHIRPEDVICISDATPVAICPFAQKDVIKSVLRGIHTDWSESADDAFWRLLSPFFGDVFDPFMDEDPPGAKFRQMLEEVGYGDLRQKFYKDGMHMLNKNQRVWEKSLEDSDLESLASLADSLIDLTGFHRILTFSQEGVGGLVDLAVISKNDGFTWIRRKSWYHKDGPMGV